MVLRTELHLIEKRSRQAVTLGKLRKPPAPNWHLKFSARQFGVLRRAFCDNLAAVGLEWKAAFRPGVWGVRYQ